MIAIAIFGEATNVTLKADTMERMIDAIQTTPAARKVPLHAACTSSSSRHCVA